MHEWLRKHLAPPPFAGDEDKTRIARWLYIILLLAVAVAFVYSLLSPFIDPKPAQAIAVNCIMLAIYSGMLVLLRKGYVALASTIFSALVWLVVTLSVAAYGSVVSPGLLNYFGVIAVAGLLLGGRAALSLAGLTILTTFGATYAEYTHRLPAPIFPSSPLIMAWVAGSNFAVTALITYMALRSVTVALARARAELAERRHAEEKLGASEERFRVMIENISDAIALVDTDHLVQYLSPTAERMLGYTAAERIGLSAFDNIASPDHVAALRQIFSELRAQPRASRSFELQARHKDGSVRWLEVTATNLLDLDSLRAFVVNYRDVNSRKQAEAALRASEEHTRRFKEYLKTLHSVSIELSRAESLDDFCRMAVELGRSQLGFDRTGLWLYDWETMTEIGTFGTDRTGQTIDERDLRFPITEISKFERILFDKQQLALHDPTEIVTFSGDKLAIGWIAQVALWDGDHVIGYISTDNALHNQPVQPYQMELLTMFGSTISHLYKRKQSEIALRESEERFRAIAESSPIAITISQMSPEGRLLYVNPRCAELYGYTPDKLGELTVNDLYFDPADRAALLAELHRQGELKNYDLQGKQADGTPVWLSLTMVPIQYAGQQALITALLDITERRKAEQTLRQSEETARAFQEKLRALHEISVEVSAAQTPDELFYRAVELGVQKLGFERLSVWMLDGEQNLHGTYTGDATGAIGDARNVQCKLADDSRDIQLMRGGVRARLWENVALKGADNVVVNGWDALAILWDGTRSIGLISIDNYLTRQPPQSYTIDLLALYGSVIGYSITRKLAEAEIYALNSALEQRVIERTAQLEAANKELEAFSYSVSHDLRAPLRAIDGYTRMLVEDYEPVLDAEGRRMCAVIRDEAQRMGRLIDDLLAFSRLSRTPMQATAIDMAALAGAAFDEVTALTDCERMEFRIEPLPAALGDPALIRQVWVNLLANAVKFSAKQPQAVIEVGGQTQGREAIYFVRDNGAGFDMRYAAKLFGVFQRLHSEHEFTGTGVGLAIVQRVVQRHGGRVWAESQVDQGATFYFALPWKGAG